MEKSFYKVITDRVEKLLCDNGFKRETNENTEYFTGDNYAVMVDYNEETQCVELKSAALNNGDTADFGVMSSWLLTNESDDRDKLSIANDFEDSLSELIGIKESLCRQSRQRPKLLTSALWQRDSLICTPLIKTHIRKTSQPMTSFYTISFSTISQL